MAKQSINILLFFCLILGNDAASAQTGSELIIARKGPVTRGAAAIRRQQIVVADSVLEQLRTLAQSGIADVTASAPEAKGQQPRVILNLFDAPNPVRFEAVIETAFVRDSLSSVIRGTLSGIPSGAFTFVLTGKVFGADVFSPSGGYRLYTDAAGAYFVEEEGPDPQFRERLLPGRPPGGRGQREPEEQLEERKEDGSRVDVLVAYTTSTKQHWGGAEQVINGVRRMEEFLNQAFVNSLPGEPPLQSRFVAIEEVPNSVGTTLEQLAASPLLKGLREKFKADLVIVVRRASGGYAGQAWVYCGSPSYHRPRAYGYVKSEYLVRIKTMAHEIGHLFGANHDPANARPDSCWHSDSRGHNFNAKDPQGVTRLYGTVMSYPGASNRIPHFSNPNVKFLGVATGTAARRNVRAIQDSRAILANYYIAADAPAPGTGPTVTFVRPQDGAQLPANTEIEIVATIVDEQGVQSAKLYWEQTNNFLGCPGSNKVDWSCTRTGDEYVWKLRVGSGSRRYSVHAQDAAGNTTVTPTRMLTLSVK